MLIRVPLLLMTTLLLSSCGIQRPLIPPRDIPAYEAERQKRRDQLERDMQNYEERTAPQNAAETAVPEAD